MARSAGACLRAASRASNESATPACRAYARRAASRGWAGRSKARAGDCVAAWVAAAVQSSSAARVVRWRFLRMGFDMRAFRTE
ncbi:Uncharacterised protein [Bordetella pertussis]|nr:Uncharacterised protein [Bordetella pertussis]